MSDIDQLEALSNTELRSECLKHGLPNVPVTSTSRNVLIKKLRASLSNTPTPKKTEKNQRSQRASLASPSVKRQEVKSPISKDVAQLPTHFTEFHTHIQEPEIFRTASKPYVAPLKDTRRTLSEVVQTSYQPTVKNVDFGSNLQDNSISDNRYERRTMNSYEAAPSYSSANVRQMPMESSLYRSTEQQQPSTGYLNLNTQATRNSFVGTPPISKPVITRPTDYNNHLQSNLSNSYRRDRDNFVDNAYQYDKDEDESIQTPFLSEFARNLERLKSQPLSAAPRSKPEQVTRRFYSRTLLSKKSDVIDNSERDVSNGALFRQVMLAIVEKYQLKRNLILFGLFLAIIFLFVLFWK